MKEENDASESVPGKMSAALDRTRNDLGARSEAIAEHTYWKLGAPIVIIVVIGLLGYFAESAITDIKTNIKYGLRQINTNVIGIALNKEAIKDVEDDIDDIEDVDARQWNLISTKEDK